MTLTHMKRTCALVAVVAVMAVPAAAQWEIGDLEVDPFTDETSQISTLAGQDRRLMLLYQCNSEGSVTASFSVFESNATFANGNVTYRFDQTPAEQAEWLALASLLVFRSSSPQFFGASPFFERMTQHNTLLVRVNQDPGVRVTDSFDLAGTADMITQMCSE